MEVMRLDDVHQTVVTFKRANLYPDCIEIFDVIKGSRFLHGWLRTYFGTGHTPNTAKGKLDVTCLSKKFWGAWPMEVRNTVHGVAYARMAFDFMEHYRTPLIQRVADIVQEVIDENKA